MHMSSYVHKMDDQAFRELFRGKFVRSGDKDTWHDPIDVPEIGPILASVPKGWYVLHYDGSVWHGQHPSGSLADYQALFVVPGYESYWLPVKMRFTEYEMGTYCLGILHTRIFGYPCVNWYIIMCKT